MELYLVAGFCIEENPAEFYDLCRVFCNIYSMLIAGGSNVNDDVSIEIALLALPS